MNNLISLEEQDLFYMQKVYALAQKAFSQDEVPIAAVLLYQDQVFESFNQRQKTQLPHDHAEFNVIDQACRKFSTWRLNDATLYVSVEPCLMCSGLIYQSRIARVVFSVENPKGGALSFVEENAVKLGVNHSVSFSCGLLRAETENMLKQFFKNKRKKL
ncbi:MAG TPA: nucleoside deaminase [Oligoflexia bacterium]|nr:nucleoside deaminase [Oligoflexia bacterium]HMR25738.1 nucleoside deaminase [Oligoflexia bacterium]